MGPAGEAQKIEPHPPQLDRFDDGSINVDHGKSMGKPWGNPWKKWIEMEVYSCELHSLKMGDFPARHQNDYQSIVQMLGPDHRLVDVWLCQAVELSYFVLLVIILYCIMQRHLRTPKKV